MSTAHNLLPTTFRGKITYPYNNSIKQNPMIINAWKFDTSMYFIASILLAYFLQNMKFDNMH